MGLLKTTSLLRAQVELKRPNTNTFTEAYFVPFIVGPGAFS